MTSLLMTFQGLEQRGRPIDQLQGAEFCHEGKDSLLFHILEGFSRPVLIWQKRTFGLLGCCQPLGREIGVSRILPKIRLRNLDAAWQPMQVVAAKLAQLGKPWRITILSDKIQSL